MGLQTTFTYTPDKQDCIASTTCAVRGAHCNTPVVGWQFGFTSDSSGPQRPSGPYCQALTIFVHTLGADYHYVSCWFDCGLALLISSNIRPPLL